MNVTVAEENGLRRKLTVEVPLEDVHATYESVYARLRSNIRVDGFRPGKFPRHLAEKRFKSAMAGEALQTLVPKYFDQAVSELELRPATEPHFDNLDIDKEKPLRFDVEFEVVPSFELLAPGAFDLTERKPQVGDQDIEARIEEQRKARAVPTDKGDAPVEAGDHVTFDFHATRDGEDFPGGEAQGQQIVVGAGQYLPDFDVQFPGTRAGESKEFDVTFPEDYAEPTLAGKEVHFTLTVHQVQQPVPPPLDEAFFKLFENCTTLEELQKHVREELEKEQQREIMQGYQNQLADQMREHYDFPVPEALVEHALHEFEHQLSHDDPEALQDETKLAAAKDAERPRIEANLRVAYAVDALAKQYEVTADPEEVRQRFYMQAYMLRQNPTELMKQPYGERMISQISQGIVTAQALERLATEVLAAPKTPGVRKTAKPKAAGKAADKATDKAADKAAKPAKAEKAAKPKSEPKAAASSKAGKAPSAKPKAAAGSKAGKAPSAKPKAARGEAAKE